jgi:hypothetical protein
VGEKPVITEMARQDSKTNGESWACAKRMYRLLENKHVRTSQLYEGLYQVGCETVAREKPEYLVVAVDPVNFEKPYVKVVEGASIVHKATPPDLTGHARLAHGYPALTATVVNTKVPVTSYANWFSYEIGFISQNHEINQAFETTCRLYSGDKVRFVGDSGLDDQKMFAKVGHLGQEFVFRVSHFERIVEVYNSRLDRWEREVLQDLTETVLYQASFEVLFKHAGKTRLDTVHLGWFRIRLPDNPKQILWVLVADDPQMDRQLELDPAEGGADLVDAVVVAQGDDVVGVGVAVVAVPGQGGHAVRAQQAQAFGQVVVGGEQHAAFAGGEVLVGEEARSSRCAPGAQGAAVQPGAGGVGGVFDDGQAVLLGMASRAGRRQG